MMIHPDSEFVSPAFHQSRKSQDGSATIDF